MIFILSRRDSHRGMTKAIVPAAAWPPFRCCSPRISRKCTGRTPWNLDPWSTAGAADLVSHTHIYTNPQNDFFRNVFPGCPRLMICTSIHFIFPGFQRSIFWGWLYSNIQQWPSPTLHTKRLLRKPWMKPWPAIVQWFIDWTWWFPYCSYVKLPQGNLAPILHCPDLPRIRKDPNQNHVFAGAFNITGKGWLDMVVS